MIRFQGTANTLGLLFFGTITASMSHEIKNALAIVNENAGLLEDLLLLSEKGRPLSPERLKTLAADIRRQVQRADGIVGRLNRFAHSAGQPVITTDTKEIFEFTAALAARLAAMKGVTITVAAGETIEVQARPFIVENLLWICLENFFAKSSDNQTVHLTAEDADSHVAIGVQFDEGVPVEDIGKLVMQQGQPLIVALQAEARIDAPRRMIRLTLPKKFEE
jgi:signal transduction histidine kinase